MRSIFVMMPVRRVAVWMAVSSIALMSAVVQAQSTPAPQPNLTKVPPVWLGLLVIFLLLALVVSVSLMPSKRGHQD